MLSPELEQNENIMFNSIKAALFTLVMGLCAIEQNSRNSRQSYADSTATTSHYTKRNLDLFSINVLDTNRRPEVVVLNMGDI